VSSTQTTPLSSTTIVGLDLVGATVANLKTSLEFYRDALGLIPAGESESGAEFHFPDGSTFGLWQPGESDGIKPGFSVMFKVGDVAEASKTARERGAQISERMESPVCFMAMGSDPEGNGVILHQRKSVDPHRPPEQTHTPTTIHGIDLAGYLVEDPQREVAFYRDVLGMTPTDVDEQGRGAEFELADGSTFGVWHMPNGQRGGFVMFAVDDARAKAEELRARGITLTDITETPVCFMAWGPDPEGNGVIIHQRKAHG